MGELHVVVGGMFGSESKGRVTASIIDKLLRKRPDRNVTCIRVAGPNAGHIVWATPPKAIAEANLSITPTKPPMEKFPMRQIPVGFVQPNCRLYIGPGSEISIAVLQEELNLLETAGFQVRNRLFISPQATILEPRHAQEEAALVGAIGSTGKGIGAARSDRIWRRAQLAGDSLELRELIEDKYIRDIHDQINRTTQEDVVIEGTQGFGLGLHAGYYPKCTSSDCRAIDFIAMSGISPWSSGFWREELAIHVVIRPYPIRVAGDSGELKNETTWDELGLAAEKTTVTQKVRRVGQFDPDLVIRAVEANGTNHSQLHLAMADQLVPECRFMDDATDLRVLAPAARRKLWEFIQALPYNEKLSSLGTGPVSQIWLSKAHLDEIRDASWIY